MGLNDVISAERPHIVFFGMRNAGKSSLVNAVTGQELSLVSSVKGTTTDPVKKAMELLPLGPVVIVDTPGIDDEGTLGEMRVKKAMQALSYADIALLVSDATKTLSNVELELIKEFEERKLPYLIAYNKSDLLADAVEPSENSIYVSAKDKTNIYELKERLARLIKDDKHEDKKIVSDLLSPGDTAVLVVPIDKAAPKGRLILPQQQTIRDLLDGGCIALVCRDSELESTLAKADPRIVITDSQAFEKVARLTPANILLTSFSILFARYKGELLTQVRGAARLDALNDGDRILISEGCTHHRQCDDIGTVKLPGWIKKYTGKEPVFEFSSGKGFPEDLSKYSLIIHCGACMLSPKEVAARVQSAKEQKIPMTNYGMAIAQIHGVLRRALAPFPEALKAIDGEKRS